MAVRRIGGTVIVALACQSPGGGRDRSTHPVRLIEIFFPERVGACSGLTVSPARRIGWQAAGHRLGEGQVDGQHAMNAGELEDAPHGAIGRDGERVYPSPDWAW